ncbi:MAG: hypothetical protein AAFQ51_14695 [Pseudomonadota bacterium]
MAKALALTLGLWLTACAALAEERVIRLAAPEVLVESGLLRHLLPRFALKTQIRVEVVAGGADMTLAPGAEGRTAFTGEDGTGYRLTVSETSALTERFAEWLFSDVGRNTIASFAPEDGASFTPGASRAVAAAIPAPVGDTVQGEKLAFQHCGRCHVIDERNRFGGIGSTPSFAALRTLPEADSRFAAFWTLNPHPSFTQVEGMTEPFNPLTPPAIAPLYLTLDDVEAIEAYAATIPPADLGQGIVAR